MPPSLSLLVLRSRAVEATLDFYRSLGIHFEQEQHGAGPLHYAAQIGEMVLEIYPLKTGQREPDDSTMLGFKVASLQEVLNNRGLEADIKQSNWGRFCSLKDPDGRTIRLTEAPPKDQSKIHLK